MKFKLYERQRAINNIKNNKPNFGNFNTDNNYKSSVTPLGSYILQASLSKHGETNWYALFNCTIMSDDSIKCSEKSGWIADKRRTDNLFDSRAFSTWQDIDVAVYKDEYNYLTGKSIAIYSASDYCLYGWQEYSYDLDVKSDIPTVDVQISIPEDEFNPSEMMVPFLKEKVFPQLLEGATAEVTLLKRR